MPTPEALKAMLKQADADLLMRKQMNEVFNRHEQMQFNMLMHKLAQQGIQKDALPSLEDLQKAFPSQQYTLKPDDTNDYKNIMDDFEKKFGADNLDRSQGCMSFSTKQDAIQFFKEQSGMERSFYVHNASEDHSIYSDGKGHFIEGSKAEVKRYIEENHLPLPAPFEGEEEGRTLKPM